VYRSDTGVPVEDRRLAVALLLELAVQRGSLSFLLDTVRLLLSLSSEVVDVDRDNRLVAVLTHAPLVPVLRRFQTLARSSSEANDAAVNEVPSFIFHFPTLALNLRLAGLEMVLNFQRLKKSLNCL